MKSVSQFRQKNCPAWLRWESAGTARLLTSLDLPRPKFVLHSIPSARHSLAGWRHQLECDHFPWCPVSLAGMSGGRQRAVLSPQLSLLLLQQYSEGRPYLPALSPAVQCNLMCCPVLSIGHFLSKSLHSAHYEGIIQVTQSHLNCYNEAGIHFLSFKL